MSTTAKEWSEADFATLLKSLDLPQFMVCERLPHLSIGALREVFQALHHYHTGGDASALTEAMRQRLLKTRKALVCPICRVRFRANARTLDAVLADLEKLQPGDFDGSHVYQGQGRLQALTDEIRTFEDRARALPALFRTFERLAAADLGTPGPLVHLVEEIGDYEEHLAESLARTPTSYTVWMVGRLLQTSTDAKAQDRWRGRLVAVREDPAADANAREAAREQLNVLSG